MPEPGDFNLLSHFNVQIGANTPRRNPDAIPTEPPRRGRGASEGYVDSTKVLKLRSGAPPSPAVRKEQAKRKELHQELVRRTSQSAPRPSAEAQAASAAAGQQRAPTGGTMITRTPMTLRGRTPECDLCINDKLIKQKAARLRAEREEDAAYARHAAALEAAQAHEIQEEKAHAHAQKVEIARAADEAKQRRLLREAAEKEADRAQYDAAARANNTAAADAYSANSRLQQQHAYAQELARQIREKQARRAAEKAGDVASLDTTEVMRATQRENIQNEYWARKKEQYRSELEQQIRQRTARMERDRQNDIASEQMRLQADKANAGLAYHDAEIKAARRQAMISEWDRAIQYKREREAAIIAQERAQERMVMEQAAEAMRREHQHQTQAKMERQRKIADFLRQQVQLRTRRRDAERDPTPDFASTGHHHHDPYVQCGSCNRKMPVNRFGHIRYPPLSKDRPRWR